MRAYIVSLSFVIFPSSISTLAPPFAPVYVCSAAFAFDGTKFRIERMRHKDLLKVNSLYDTHSTQRTHTWLEFSNILNSEIVLLCDECRWQFLHNATIIESFNQRKYWHTRTHPNCSVAMHESFLLSIQHPEKSSPNGKTNNKYSR